MKRFCFVLILLIVVISTSFAVDFKVGTGVSYRPLSNDLSDFDYFFNKDSWSLTTHLQLNLKHVGGVVNITPDYIAKDNIHITTDVGLDLRHNFGIVNVNLGFSIPFTFYNGEFGIDDTGFKNIPALVKTKRTSKIFWGTEIFGGLEFDVAKRFTVGTRYSVAIGRFQTTSLFLSDFLKAGLKKGQIDLYTLFKVH